MPRVVVQDLHFQAVEEAGILPIIDGISFDLVDNEFVCILGPSGCGKSTLLKIIAGLREPSSGRVKHEGFVSDPPRLGMMFQEPTLLPWRTVTQNLTLPLELMKVGKAERTSRVKRWIEIVGLEGFEDYYPLGLSGGMAQRVALARALIHEPDYLLFDEPFGALDALTREQMADELLQVWSERKKGIIMVTHSISEAILLSDKILVLSARPARIVKVIHNPFPRPRLPDIRYSTEFLAIGKEIREVLDEKQAVAAR
jgi:NitT/TauT family transport system ATP-binding protein